jgi:hypothetical protein
VVRQAFGKAPGEEVKDREVGVQKVPVAHAQFCVGRHSELALLLHNMHMRDVLGGGSASDVDGGTVEYGVCCGGGE